MESLKDIEAQLTLELSVCKNLEENIKASRRQIELLRQQKQKVIQNCSFEEKLEIRGIDLSEYMKIDVTTYFNDWWLKFLQIYENVYVKDGRYYGELNDELKDILIINSYDKNINDLEYIGNISCDYNTRKEYLYRDSDNNNVYFNKNKWVRI